MNDAKIHSPKPNAEGASPGAREDEQAEYCRALEAHLCRRNGGHLVRIVGPAFEQVCGWSMRGIPLRLAMRGVDRCVERYQARGPRRRPVRIEFCEADVLDVFDEWRRSVGVSASPADSDGGADPSAGADTSGPRTGADPKSGTDLPSPRQPAPSGTLPAHLERVIARLTTLRTGEDLPLDSAIDAIVRELDGMRSRARAVRGDPRELLLDRLRELDASLLGALRAQSSPEMLAQLADAADEELRPFLGRMPPEAYRQSQSACVDRLLRDRARLPTIAYG